MNNRKQQFAKQLGRNIAKYRQTMGLTQEQLAEKMDIGNEAISRIERGITMPSLMRLFDFSDVFNCHINDLLVDDRPYSKIEAEVFYLASRLQSLDQRDRRLIIEMMGRLTMHFRYDDSSSNEN